MSHADEGVLHAYIDGELSAMETVKLESHLGECQPCRARLDEARTVVRRAGDILGLAAPPAPSRPQPLLHQLRYPRPWWRYAGVGAAAIAATVVLALGVRVFTRGGSERPAELARRDSPVVARRMLAARPASPVRESASAPGGSVADTVSQAKTAATHDSAAVVASAAAMDRVQPSPPPMPAVTTAAQPPTQRALDTTTATVANKARQSEGPGRHDTIPQTGQAIAAEGAAPRVAQRMLEEIDSTRLLLGRAAATIPGLPVHRSGPSATQPGTVVVEQAIDSTTVIQLLERKVDAAASRDEVAALSASGRLVRLVGNLQVEISGPVAADSLAKLLALVR